MKDNLPEIKIINITDELHSRLDLEMEDSTFKLFVDIGKRDVTNQDYFEIGFKSCLKESLERIEAEHESTARKKAKRTSTSPKARKRGTRKGVNRGI